MHRTLMSILCGCARGIENGAVPQVVQKWCLALADVNDYVARFCGDDSSLNWSRVTSQCM
jgi:hypothetical protein